MLVGLGAAPTPEPRRLLAGADAPALAADPVHELERIKECGGDRDAAVADRLALLQRPEREGLAFQVHVPGGQFERLGEPAAGVREHQAERSDLGALMRAGGGHEALDLVRGEVFAFAGRGVQLHPETEQLS